MWQRLVTVCHVAWHSSCGMTYWRLVSRPRAVQHQQSAIGMPSQDNWDVMRWLVAHTRQVILALQPIEMWLAEQPEPSITESLVCSNWRNDKGISAFWLIGWHGRHFSSTGGVEYTQIDSYRRLCDESPQDAPVDSMKNNQVNNSMAYLQDLAHNCVCVCVRVCLLPKLVCGILKLLRGDF